MKTLFILISILFLGCSNGSSDEKNNPALVQNASTQGTLVYRNGSQISIFDIAHKTSITIEPGPSPFISVGMGVSRNGLIATAEDGDDSYDFFIVLYSRDGKFKEKFGIKRKRSFLASGIAPSRDGSMIAFTINEENSAVDDTRVHRTLVVNASDGSIMAEITGMEDPVWIDNPSELALRTEGSGQLVIFDSRFNQRTTVTGVEVSSRRGDYSVSPNGRFIVWADGRKLKGFDRQQNQQWVMAEDKLSSVYSPTFSPDGSHVAIHARIMVTYRPHIIPFSVGHSILIDSNIHSIAKDGITETIGRIGWF
jgi:hypothetical protein